MPGIMKAAVVDMTNDGSSACCQLYLDRNTYHSPVADTARNQYRSQFLKQFNIKMTAFWDTAPLKQTDVS
jgi:hypothetical protein